MELIVDKILELSKLSESKISLDHFIEELLKITLALLNAEYCAIALLDQIDNHLFFHIGLSKHNKLPQRFSDDHYRIKKSAGVFGLSVEKRIVQQIFDCDISPDDKNEIETKLNILPSTILIAPMLSRGDLRGAIVVINKSDHKIFPAEDESHLRILAGYAAMIVDNARILDEFGMKERISSLGQSIMNSAHEIKNILNNMDGGAFIVEKGASSKDMPAVEKGWEIIKRNTNRLRELVLDILLFSRPKKPEFKSSNINRICEDIEELLVKNATANNVEIKLFLDRSIGEFCFDPKGIHRCLLNLISNAVHACTLKGGGRVNITTKLKDPQTLEIIVSDNGVGISAENLAHIFDVFFTTKGTGGTGLGLPVTKKIIDEHDGTIEVKSTVNIGTKFIITLPNYELAQIS